MDLGKKIQQVLKYYPSVYIHGLGVFKKIHQSAAYDEQRNVFLPPIDYIEFDERDRQGLDLVGYLQQENNITRSDAEALVAQEVESIHSSVGEQGKARIAQLGDLLRYGDGFIFKPLDLSSFVFEPISNVAPIAPADSKSETENVATPVDQPEEAIEPRYEAEDKKEDQELSSEEPLIESTDQEQFALEADLDSVASDTDDVEHIAADWGADEPILDADHTAPIEAETPLAETEESAADYIPSSVEEDKHSAEQADDHAGVEVKFFDEENRYDGHSDFEETHSVADVSAAEEQEPETEAASRVQAAAASGINDHVQENNNVDLSDTDKASEFLEETDSAVQAPEEAPKKQVPLPEAPPIIQNRSQAGRPVEASTTPQEEDYPYASEYVDEDNRSNTIWYILAAVVALSIIGGLWYATRPASLYSGDTGVNLDEEYDNPYAIDEDYNLPAATDEMLDTSAVLQQRPDTAAIAAAVPVAQQPSNTTSTQATAANQPVIPANHTWYIVIASRIPADDARELVESYHKKGKSHVRILYGRGENGPSTVIWDSYVNKAQADAALVDVRKNFVADAWPSPVKK